MGSRTSSRRSLGSSRPPRDIAAPDLVVPHPPRPVVLRPRLFDALDEGAAGPLTLISAPAGAGKTALLSSWLGERTRTDVAWLSVRPGRGESAFWAEWLEAVRRLVPTDSLLGQLVPPRVATPSGFVVQLLNGLSELDEPIVVVVDDFHEARGNGVAWGLEQVIRAAPGSLRLVISTRHDPALPVHILRASGELAELRARDLAFTPEEARELLGALQLELEPGDFATLLDRTEGWAAGLRLFTISLSRRRDTASAIETLALDERPAVEYLTAEALASQPAELREFLVRTSIVDRLTPELADALTGRDDGAHVLEQLVAENLFTDRLDTHPTWYRYHRLFAELLRAELRHDHRSELGNLHARAARWHVENGAPLDAVHHAFAAGDVELATSCIVDHWFDLLARSDITFRGELIDKVPEQDVHAAPKLCAISASLELLGGNVRRGARLLEKAEADWPEASEPSERAVLAFAQLQRSSLEGRFDDATRLAAELLEIAVTAPLPQQSAETLRTIALGHLGVSELFLARYDEAETHLEEALQLSREVDVPTIELACLSGLASRELTNGRLRRAARLAQGAIELAEIRGGEHSSAAALAYTTLALVEHDWDELDKADSYARHLAEIARAAGDRVAGAWSAVVHAALCLAWGGDSIELGLQHLRGSKSDLAEIEAPLLQRFAAHLEARLLAAAGEPAAAEAFVDRCLAERPRSAGLLAVRARLQLAGGDPQGALATLAQDSDVTHSAIVVERLALGAVAYQAVGNHAEALASLGAALDLAEPEGIRRPLLGIGPPLRELLAEHLRQSPTQRWLASELLRRLDGTGGNGAVPAELLEPLSAREVEVLRYLPTMMSNADIAAELFVSVNTVKTHVKSIYRKLDASRRQDAVRRARQLHLL